MRPYYSCSDIKIFNGDCLDVLRGMDAESIDMCITSPPYWGLRDYGTAKWEGGDINCNHIAAKEKSRYDYDLSKAQTGTHSGAKTGTDQAKWKKKCPSCGAIKKDSQLGLEPTFHEYIDKLVAIFDEVKRVLKDTGTCWVNLGDTYSGSGDKGDYKDPKYKEDRNGQRQSLSKLVMPKSLIGIPERFAIAMTDTGWIRRNTIIWHKPNCMPSSVKDRFTVDFEYLYFFSKSKKYYFEQQFDEYTAPMNRWGGDNLKADNNSTWDKGTGQVSYRDRNMRPNEQGRNKRCVWEINTKPYKKAHFAVYPESLIETPIKAGCPKDSTVLDPFMGSGTTLKVASELGRKGIGIELNTEYIKMALKRINVSQKLLKI